MPGLVQIMAWRRPVSEPIMVSLLTHICVTRPHWVNFEKVIFNIFLFLEGHKSDRTPSDVNKHALATTRVNGAKKRDQLYSSGKETSASQTDVDTNFTISGDSTVSSEYAFLQIWQNGKKVSDSIDGFVQDCNISGTWAMEILQSCTKKPLPDANYTIAPVKPHWIMK